MLRLNFPKYQQSPFDKEALEAHLRKLGSQITQVPEEELLKAKRMQEIEAHNQEIEVAKQMKARMKRQKKMMASVLTGFKKGQVVQE